MVTRRRLPLAMLYGLAGMAARAFLIVSESVARVLLRIAEPEPFKLEAELEQAKQADTAYTVEKPTPVAYGNAQARDFVTMLRGIGSGGAALA